MDEQPRGRSAGRQVGRHLLAALAIGGAVALTVLMPAMVGMTWQSIFHVLAGISFSTLLALSVLWIAGLAVQTTVLTAALPGLSHRRALLLNLSGSAVSNLLPFGGAAGVGLGYAMARTWKVPPADFASFTAISNLWNLLGKLVVGAAVLSFAVGFGLHLPAALHGGLAIGSSAVLLLVVAVAVAMVCSARVAAVVGRLADRLLAPVARRLGRPLDVGGALRDLRASSAAAVSQGWARLTVGVLGYLLMQALLMGACLMAVGAETTWVVIAVAFAVERLISVLPITPGGAGLAEIGGVAVLIALGVDPVAAAAGTLLYRVFTFLLEIPVGGASVLLWLGSVRLRAAADA